MLLAFVLPNLGENVDSETSQKAVKVKQYLDEKLSSKLFIHCLTEHLDKFIFHMIRNMHDPAYLSKLCAFFGNMDDDKNTLFCTRMQIVETLENFGAKANESLLEKITLQVPSTTIKILVPLLENVYQAILYEDKVFAFYKYILFVDIISDVTNKGSRYYTINTFIIRDVVYSLLAIVRQDEAQTLTDMACECLKKIAESYLPEFSAIFGESLPAITTVLIPSVLNFNTKALDVLHFLICENYLKLEQNIILLDPFPAHEIFYEINQQISKTQVVLTSLKSIVKHFVKIGGSENSVCRIEGIKYLRKSLSNKKDELKKMYEDLIAVRGFSEDCKRSLLHQLICTLIELANNKNLTVSNCNLILLHIKKK